ncbi:MAG TPA: lysylphosphatidylglycerol synthase transmembrane domain-containing protein [Anaerolineales bacterium]|nr:lysylphosphatidylglycerol synthase transmembrane domain-containing protein [Anaerolineales bacterium]
MKRWQFWLGVAISAYFLYSVFSKLDFSEFWAAVRQANYWWILPGVSVYFLGVWVRAWRWHYLLRPVKPVPTGAMFPIVAIGYMGNNIYPARAGELLRAYVLKRREGVSISASLATIIVERVYDGVVMLAFIFVNISELSRMTGFSIPVGRLELSIQAVALWGSLAFFGALLVFLLAAMYPAAADRLVVRITGRFVPQRLRLRLLDLSRRFLGGLESLRSPQEALMVFLTSLVIWLLETGKYWFVMHAFDFKIDFFALMLMNGVVNLATTIPSAPGYWGTFDLPGIEVLKAYGVNAEVAAGYTLALHIALLVPITLLGAYYLWREGLRWGEALDKARVEG